jgi:hypothetical protein
MNTKSLCSIKVSEETKNRLDGKKIIPEENYNHTISKLLDYCGTATIWGTK